jgi:hypothetical protein
MLPRNPNLFIQPLDPGDFIPTEQTTSPGLTQLVTDTLGDAGTPADGFDQVYAEANAMVDAVDAGLGLLDGDYEGTFSDAGATNPQAFAETAAAVQASLVPADKAFADFTNVLPGGTPPGTTPAPHPAGSGGGATSPALAPRPIPAPTPAL